MYRVKHGPPNYEGFILIPQNWTKYMNVGLVH